MCYLYLIDQIHNPNKILTSLLTDLTSTHKRRAIGRCTLPTSDVHLQQQIPFRQNSINNSYPELRTMLQHLCNYTSQLSFPSGWSVYNMSGTVGHSFAFSGRLPSTYGTNTPFVRATLVSSLSVSETTNKIPETLLFAIDFSCCLFTLGIFFLFGTTAYLYIPTNWTGTSTLVYLGLDLSIALNCQTLPIPLIHNWPKWAIQFIPAVNKLRNRNWDCNRDHRTRHLSL